MRSRTWLAKVGMALFAHVDVDVECTAVCGDAESIVKKNAISANELRSDLEGIPGIRIIE